MMIEQFLCQEYICSNDELAKIIVEKYNSGEKITDISKQLGLSPSTLSRRIKELFYTGIIREYYNIALEKLLAPSWIYIIKTKQRISLNKCFYSRIVPDIVFWSPYPRPTYVLYFLSRKNDPIDYKAITPFCELVVQGKIAKTIIPEEKPISGTIEIRENNQFQEVNDDVDELILKFIFKYVNPPRIGEVKLHKKILDLSYMIPPASIKYHYYNHVYKKAIVKRLIYRPYGRYAIMFVVSEGTEILHGLIRVLTANGLLVGVDQIFVLSTIPAVAVLHVWINEEKAWDPDNHHKFLGHVYYEIIPMEKIM